MPIEVVEDNKDGFKVYKLNPSPDIDSYEGRKVIALEQIAASLTSINVNINALYDLLDARLK